MRQKSRTRDFCLPWAKLLHQAERQRVDPNDTTVDTTVVTRSPHGKPIADWTKGEKQFLTCQIQPWGGSISWKPEGLLQDTTHILFCNMVVASSSAVLVDIKAGDRIVGPDAVIYRAVFVDNAAGVNHHYEVLLSSIFPSGT